MTLVLDQRLVDVEQKLSRLHFTNHPVVSESQYMKHGYYSVLYFITTEGHANEKIRERLKIYAQSLGISESELNLLDGKTYHEQIAEILPFLKMMKKNKQILNQWGIFHKDFSCLVIADSIIVTSLTDYVIEESEILSYCLSHLGISHSTVQEIREYFNYLFNDNLYLAKTILENKEFSDLTYYYQSIQEDLLFQEEEGKQISIIATMSSGKSTLLNALIDEAVFPVETKACTAKLLQFTYNPSHQRLFAFAKGSGAKVSWTAKEEELKQWNKQDEIDGIYVEGQAGPLALLNKKTTIIDTPGANNSRDITHGEITQKHIKRSHHHQYLYILNGTQLAINDDKELLGKLLKYVDPKNIIFVLNKVDLLDLEGQDDLEDLMVYARSYLQDLGLKRPILIPTAAAAAGIFKKALKGKALTSREMRYFENYYETFLDETYNLNKYTSVSLHAPGGLYGSLKGEVEVRGKFYDKQTIIKALYHTGFVNIEYQLLINGRS